MSKYKNIRGYDPLNIETPYRFNETNSNSNENPDPDEIYDPSEMKLNEYFNLIILNLF